MRAMTSGTIQWISSVKLVELPKPAVSDGRVLLRDDCGGVRRSTYDSVRPISRLEGAG